MPSPAATAGDRAWIRLLRTHCFGSCPVYGVTIYEDGEVVWEGIDHVGTRGPAGARVQIEEARRILARFRTLEPPEEDRSFSYRTDQPSIVIEDGSRRVVHDYGSDQEALVGIENLADDIDALTQTQRWVETSCSGAASDSLTFGDGIELDREVRDLSEEAIAAVVHNLTEAKENVARLRAFDDELGRRRTAFVERELAVRGIDPVRVLIRLIDRGLNGPDGWDDGAVWIDYGPPACI